MEFNFDQIKDGYIATLKKYNDFSGRSRRQEFWTFFFCNIAISMGFNIIGAVLPGFLGTLFNIAGSLFGLAVLVPNIAVGVRRLHDTNRTGKFMLLYLACCVGGLVPLYFATQEGTSGDNQYGPDPKAVPQA